MVRGRRLLVLAAFAPGFGGSAAATEPPKPIPAARAFALPSVDECVTKRTLTFRLRSLQASTWAGATVKVDGKQFKRVKRAGVSRPVKLRGLPRGRFVLSVTARTRDGRSAAAERTYQTCNDTRPVVAVPQDAPPTTLRLRDIDTGTGRQAKSPRNVSVHYVMVTWSDGREIDASWDRDEPLGFTLGADMVIAGFEQGIVGMKIGGRREIVIPPALGYGDDPTGPIPANETLIAVVDLVSVR